MSSDTTPSYATRAEDWLRTRRTAVLAAVIVLSAVLRIAYFVQLNDGPCLWQHRWDQSDMHFFNAWAEHIAAGDLLLA